MKKSAFLSRSRFWLLFILLLGAGYSHYLTTLILGSSAPIFCSGSTAFDCSANLHGSYSHLFGIPISGFATAMYVFLFTYSMLKQLASKDKSRDFFILPLMMGYLAASVVCFYVFVSLFVLGSLCLSCSILYLIVAATVAVSYAGLGVPLRMQPAVFHEYFRGTDRLPRIDDVLEIRKGRMPRFALTLSFVMALLTISAHKVEQSSSLLSNATHKQDACATFNSTSKTITIFSDFECPACKIASKELEKLKTEFTGNLEIQYVNFPLCGSCNPEVAQKLHPNACLAAKIGIVMKERGKFLGYHHRLMNVSGELTEPLLYDIVAQLGEDKTEIRRLANLEATNEALQRDLRLGRSHGVVATPSLLIDGKLVKGAVSAAKMKELLRAAPNSELPLPLHDSQKLALATSKNDNVSDHAVSGFYDGGKNFQSFAVKGRIIDGVNLVEAVFPTVGEIGDQDFGFYCTGTLIASNFVLTAAHCLAEDFGNGLVIIGATAGRFRLAGTVYNSSNIFIHPAYQDNLEGQTEGNFDLAIMQLNTPVLNITPTPLYTQGFQLGQLLGIAGYGELGTGSTGENGLYPAAGTIQFAVTPIDIITTTYVKWIFDNVPAPNNEGNTASGDSGGPAFVVSNDQLQLAAVTTGGDDPLGLARFGETSYSTRVDTALSWIYSIIPSLRPPPPPPEAATPKPDLVISSANVPSPLIAGQPTVFTAVVSNNGNADAGDFFVSIFLNQPTPVNSSGGAAATQLVRGLTQGTTTTVSFTLTYPASGNYMLAILADSENNIQESSDLNNTLFRSVVVTSQGIDLLIQSVTVTESSPGTTATFDLVLENRGAVATGLFTLAFYSNLVGEPTASTVPDQILSMGSLAGGGTVSASFTLPTQSAPRAGRAWFFADHTNSIAENIETNNKASSTWGVTNAAPAVSSTMAGSASLASVGQSVTFSIGVSDPTSDPLSYLWDFGDGTTALNGSTLTHTYTAAGIYIVTVTVSDGPFNTFVNKFTIEIVSDAVVDLGTISLSGNRGLVNLNVPIPDPITKGDRPKSKLIAGNPGPKVKYRSLILRGKALTTGVFTFTVEFRTRVPANLKRLRCKYTVVP